MQQANDLLSLIRVSFGFGLHFGAMIRTMRCAESKQIPSQKKKNRRVVSTCLIHRTIVLFNVARVVEWSTVRSSAVRRCVAGRARGTVFHITSELRPRMYLFTT
jgi:hypothetical protein